MADEAPATPAATEPEQHPNTHNGKPTMMVKVYAPFQVYFEGDAYSVSAENATGPFDILPRHHNFLCMLIPCTLRVEPVEGEHKVIKIHRALMHVKADRVVIFMDV
jgi:F0F1-type ATP synthase epsilon subunit